jgi:hypothetical protein
MRPLTYTSGLSATLATMSQRLFNLGKMAIALSIFLYIWQAWLDGSAAKKAPATQVEGWIIRQTSNEGGPVLSEITRNAIRISLAKYRWVFIAQAPTWNILFLNDRTKNFVVLSNDQWRRKFLVLQGSKSQRLTGKLEQTSRASGRTAKIANLSAKEYVVERGTASPNSGLKERIAEIWTSSDIKAPPPVAEIVCKLTRLPNCKGIPLRANLKSNGKMVSVLETIDVKQERLLASIFEPAKDWLQVHDQIRVLFGEPADTMVNDYVDPARSETGLKPPNKIAQ